ncbi:MAG: VOC family protein [Rubricoccaceae bacterium]
MSSHHTIHYVELPSTDLPATKAFCRSAFGWDFEDYGPDYTAILGAGLDGGFYTSDQVAREEAGSALVILYSDDLESSLEQVKDAGGTIVKDIFSFPGGRRFHFTEPSGTELAVWTESDG